MKMPPISISANGSIKVMYCLIDVGGIPMWMQGTRQKMKEAGLRVLREEMREIKAP